MGARCGRRGVDHCGGILFSAVGERGINARGYLWITVVGKCSGANRTAGAGLFSSLRGTAGGERDFAGAAVCLTAGRCCLDSKLGQGVAISVRVGDVYAWDGGRDEPADLD